MRGYDHDRRRFAGVGRRRRDQCGVGDRRNHQYRKRPVQQRRPRSQCRRRTGGGDRAAGRLNYRVNRPDWGADTLINNGTLNLSGTSTFGAGTDALINTGVITVLGGTASVAALEATSNSGIIDLRNASAVDRLILSGNFTGSGASALGIDVQSAGGTGAADRLVIAGAATGQTTVLVNTLAGQPGAVINGAVVVDAGAGSSAGAFVLPTTSAGFIDYSLRFAASTNDFLLFGTPGAAALTQYKQTEGARQLFLRGNDAVGSHLQAQGDDDRADAPAKNRLAAARCGA